jgi:spore germination protein YaaH
VPKVSREKKILWSIGLINVFIIVGFFVVMHPNNEYIEIFEKKKNYIVYKGEVLSHVALYKDESLFLPLEFVKKHIEPNAYLDEPSNSIILTTNSKVLQFKNKELQAFINEEAFEINAPVTKVEDDWYIPTEVIGDFYPYDFYYSLETGLVIMVDKGKGILKAEINSFLKKEGIPIRLKADRKEPIVSFVDDGEIISVIKEMNQWSLIQKENGEFGYIDKKFLSQNWEEMKKWEESEEVDYKFENLTDKKINLVWEAVYHQKLDIDALPQMEGVNVLSPTWFELKNDEGDIKSKVDTSYVEWAHDKGIQVWALFSNAFDPDMTHEVLKDFDKRKHVIKQIVAYVETYKLDGINLDFEYVYLKDKEALVQFVRELTPYLHKQGAVVSIDVTIHSTSEMWSMFYDRKRLSEIVDYVAVMTYDEHPSNSQIAGSVASLPWVEKGLVGVLEEVPSEKLLLGIPFYTRVWTETDEGMKSDTLSMANTKNFIERHDIKYKMDEVSGQNYSTYYDEEKKIIRKVWFEDETSLIKRLGLVDKYNLAGIAVWQRSFADNGMWSVINERLHKE